MSAVGNLVGKVVGGITGESQQADAAQQAAGTQAASSQAAIDEQRRQFDAIVGLMSPYLSAGSTAIGAQQNLLGLSGPYAQQLALSNLEQSPFFQSQLKQGQNAMLQNASATGGLRGGNVQAAMGLLAPQLLNQTYQQQLANLGGLSQIGQASAAGQASMGQASATNIGNLLGQQGAALAGGQMAAGAVPSQSFNTLLKVGGLAAGLF